ncbi:MAG: lipoate-protein ligase A related protein [Candidatus Omnitrophica bacterium CG11_big_fil_rev_8_21_14_0_20_64_10]|nr:MAG: lipoate-protein ligase A related protein [Candidatus Omnitrophica bacterium CG11_big_fil_rev_8_21_14_0_20_64_10]
MKLLDLTFPTPEENLACDEALLDGCQAGRGTELLRFWEPDRPFVVLGLSNRIGSEVRAAACGAAGVPILRRISGGGAVLQGPGCLNFSLVLQIPPAGPLAGIASTNAFILDRHRSALQPLLAGPVRAEGCSDLTLAGLKFSGSAQRRKRTHMLFHGCFLLDLNLPLMEALLPLPARRPAYRKDREHRAFLTPLPLPASAVKRALSEAWSASGAPVRLPAKEIARLARVRYRRFDWTARF